jgi:hypothetical protein
MLVVTDMIVKNTSSIPLCLVDGKYDVLKIVVFKMHMPRYTEQQFIEVSVKVLPKIGENMARYIGFTVFRSGGDIRDVMSVGKLIRKGDGPQEVEWMINTMTKYGGGEKDVNIIRL